MHQQWPDRGTHLDLFTLSTGTTVCARFIACFTACCTQQDESLQHDAQHDARLLCDAFRAPRVTGQPHSTAAAAPCSLGPTCTRGTKASVKVRRTASKVTSVEASYRDGGCTLAVTVYSRCAPASVGDPTRSASVTERPAIHPVRVLVSVPSVSLGKDPILRRGQRFSEQVWSVRMDAHIWRANRSLAVSDASRI